MNHWIAQKQMKMQLLITIANRSCMNILFDLLFP